MQTKMTLSPITVERYAVRVLDLVMNLELTVRDKIEKLRLGPWTCGRALPAIRQCNVTVGVLMKNEDSRERHFLGMNIAFVEMWRRTPMVQVRLHVVRRRNHWYFG